MDKRYIKILGTAIVAVCVSAAVFMFSGKRTDIGTDRQFVWDTAVIDREKTTAAQVYHSPQRQETVFTADKEWEKGTADGFNIVETDTGYRMYYSVFRSEEDTVICCADSTDGINWYRPEIGAVEYNGRTENNIIFGEGEGLTGFFAFRDENAQASGNEKYKALGLKADGSFASYVSADGTVWQRKNEKIKNIVTDVPAPVSLASVFWNKQRQKYYCYFVSEKGGKQQMMLSVSKDFEKWKKPQAVMEYKEQHIGVQTANILPYYRGENMFVGFPMRAVEVDTSLLESNFSANSITTSKLTDTVFVSSSDGRDFDISTGAVITPGPQNGSNWVFGDSFVAGGIVETESLYSRQGQDRELSIYVAENMLTDNDTQLVRYTLRKDGFSSFRAPYSTQKVVTQPLEFDGNRMTVNFSTSTDGYLYVRIVDKNGKPFGNVEYTSEDGTVYTVPQYTSYKMIGDRTDREVVFNGDISRLAGKKVVIEFYLSDADLYSFRFDNENYTTDTSDWQRQNIEIREYNDFTYGTADSVLDIGSDRQLFVDDFITDLSKTDAAQVSHSPVRRQRLFRTDLPWEGDNCDFYVIMDDTDSEGKPYHRMYYLGWDSSDFTDIRVCYAYSYDGIEWTKPDLGLHSYTDKATGKTYTDTNIVLYTEEEIFDNFFVMKDTRQGVPDSQKYKAICQGRYDQLGFSSYGLWAWTSPDGLHWTKTHRVLPQMEEWFGSFDSVNSLVWDDATQQFFTYFRVRENQHKDGIDWVDFRKIYGAVGEDFKPFDTDTIFALDYGSGAPLFEMYTNNIIKYHRAPQLFMGFPTRFSRNSVWQKNYEYLSSPQARLDNYNSGQLTRTLSMTDTMLMTSRDGYLWNRQNEAFITPGPEYEANWIYGNCYPAYGLVETAGDTAGADNLLTTYLFDGKFYDAPTTFFRYTMRLDGFRSYRGNAEGQKVTTKPLSFTGDSMCLNFSTSAAGSVRVNILDESGQLIDGYSSAVLVGNNTDRRVVFTGDLSRLSGQTVIIEFVLQDAEIYSFRFQ